MIGTDRYRGSGGLIFVILGFITLVITGGLFGCPTYKVWQQQKEGEAELSRAIQNRNIRVLEAKAKQESAEYESQAEIIRARGAAKANQIIDSSLTVQYLHYLWVQGLREGKNEVIYVPTEGSIPIMEASRFNRQPVSEPAEK